MDKMGLPMDGEIISSSGLGHTKQNGFQQDLGCEPRDDSQLISNEAFRSTVNVVARKILRLRQVVAVVVLDDYATDYHARDRLHLVFQDSQFSDADSDQPQTESMPAWTKVGDAQVFHEVSRDSSIFSRQLHDDSSLLGLCRQQIEENSLIKLAASGSLVRHVSLVDNAENIIGGELVSQLAVFPLESPDAPECYLFILLSRPLSPIFIRSIRLLVKTSNVFHAISKSENERSLHRPTSRSKGVETGSLCELDFLRAFSESSFGAIVVANRHQIVTFANLEFCNVFGISSQAESVGVKLNYFLFIKQDRLQGISNKDPIIVSACHVSGKALLLTLKYRKIFVNDDEYVIYFLNDQTMVAWEEEHKKIYQHQLSSIFDLALVGIFEVNSREECVFSNAYLDKLLGRPLVGGAGASWLEIFDIEDQQEIQMDLYVELQHAGIYTKYCQVQTYNGAKLWIRFHACPNQAIEGGFVGTITDETAQRIQEIRLRDLAELDQLTGLVNRHVLNERLKNAIQYIDRYGAFCVMCLDLDGFKNINDSLGHDVGDALLVDVAKRLRRVTRQVDVVARMGGDEFVILLANGMNETAASRIASSLIAEIRQPFNIGNRLLYITVSVGIVFCNESDESSATILKHGDMALYRAKDSGRNNFQFFTPELGNAARYNLDIITALHEALTNKEFYVQYQPQLDLVSGEIFGFEALLRWSPKLDYDIQPSAFIELLEGTGLIHDVGSWMLETCLQDFARWRKSGWISKKQKLSINISPLQLLLTGFAEQLAERCDAYELEPCDLILELNETSFMDRVLKGESVVHEIKARKFALAVDDFGTGYSSILALIQLNVDYLKIDTSLMRDIFSDPKDLAVVDSILAIGDRLGIDVIAVGVDHPAKINYLRDLGCRICQGFVCSRPMTASFLEQELFKTTPVLDLSGLG